MKQAFIVIYYKARVCYECIVHLFCSIIHNGLMQCPNWFARLHYAPHLALHTHPHKSIIQHHEQGRLHCCTAEFVLDSFLTSKGEISYRIWSCKSVLDTHNSTFYFLPGSGSATVRCRRGMQKVDAVRFRAFKVLVVGAHCITSVQSPPETDAELFQKPNCYF